ncbi:MAG: hypothetical protein A2504_13610 [Bdellovibrionales bacterium RIFOXYD12_FULL_39_22]|nr:MAG: hypothetical protein A2385_00335 [Bdellovibrionales bacterium RIFOXYB1_FULL_39_21]OFZ43875.1 MAG: hypothetical protein A2485_05195 [Bdellovibrionales bacterium RIFOXYC12_FULL_39_17]OFZ48791.1 MAG: hypothetical protein A2404_17650 [Bdellovibrionales bacterium RIFOXYC1_FULL_39_130]OFZ76524.1 MAG: hypothetical protein A2560_06315 [Bdellovibrionales bacterium RIFOXYD1_FULL_39_84]OFZ94758.1 MAG: hypothetical protein A2504_13610 [Bdellovibrionales bacterium RIFOXYD12_FULL_39_22]HLE12181.1 hy
MKKLDYTWDERYFLLHLQINKQEGQKVQAQMIRQFRDGSTQQEMIEIKPKGPSHRFLVTRTHPQELSFTCEYPQDVELEAFKLDDRAYYPTESFFKN